MNLASHLLDISHKPIYFSIYFLQIAGIEFACSQSIALFLFQDFSESPHLTAKLKDNWMAHRYVASALRDGFGSPTIYGENDEKILPLIYGNAGVDDGLHFVDQVLIG